MKKAILISTELVACTAVAVLFWLAVAGCGSTASSAFDDVQAECAGVCTDTDSSDTCQNQCVTYLCDIVCQETGELCECAAYPEPEERSQT
jgi:hypothetical protein